MMIQNASATPAMNTMEPFARQFADSMKPSTPQLTDANASMVILKLAICALKDVDSTKNGMGMNVYASRTLLNLMELASPVEITFTQILSEQLACVVIKNLCSTLINFHAILFLDTLILMTTILTLSAMQDIKEMVTNVLIHVLMEPSQIQLELVCAQPAFI